MHDVGSSVTSKLTSRSAGTQPDPVSAHIVDTTIGRPAAGVFVTMSKLRGVNQGWTKLGSNLTNEDGMASNFVSRNQFGAGTYKMHFSTGQYFRDQHTESCYPYAEVVFEIKDPSKHYHVPLLLNPFGYSAQYQFIGVVTKGPEGGRKLTQ